MQNNHLIVNHLKHKTMKINIFKNLIFVSIFALCLQGCSEDFLDLINPNGADEETFWTSRENAESAMATIYSPLRGQRYGDYGGVTRWHTMKGSEHAWLRLRGAERHEAQGGIARRQTA